MSEIRPTSQQMDREKLSQDIEKLKLAVKDTSLNRTWDDYSDSDDDALHITEDQNSRDVNDDGHLGERVGVGERFFPEEALQGISQDSLGSLGSVELTNSPEVCLALNREYQDWIRKNLTRIQIVLEHNRQCQREVRLEMQEKSSEKMALNAKRKTLTVYAKPYFKTADGSFPPPNDDTMIKRNSRELDPFIRPPKTWSSSERNRLRAAVQADRLQKALRPFMSRKEIEVERLRMVTPDSEEELQIKEKIEDIDNKMKAIRTSSDINMVYGELKDLESIDWMKIANVDFEGQRSAEACKLFWLNAAHPNINVLKWTPAEDTKLIEFVSKFEGVHWMEIAQGLGTNRSAFMCLQRYQTKLNPCLQTGKWTPEEDEFLKEVINNYQSGDSIPWSTVAYYVEGRSREQCARRWEQLHPKSFKKGKWTVEEDKKLMEAAKLFGVNKWWKIREFVPGRTAAQCRERWKNTLDYSIHFGEWRYEEDRTLWLTVQELGAGHWQSIAKEYLPGRTDNMCLQRYRRLVHWYQENKAQERVKRQSKGGWRQSRRWKKLTDKQHLKRKQLEKVLDRVKTDEKQKEILSALKYVEGICEDGQGQGQGDDGRSEKAEQHSDLENRAVAESGDYLYSANEIEAIRRDEDLGIVIPRPSTRSCLNRNCLPELRKYRLRKDIGRRVATQVLSERRAPSSLRSRLNELIGGKGTSSFSQPLQEKLQSLSDNATIRELIDLSAEVKQEVTSTLGSTSGQQRGRPKRSEEEAEVEHKISMLICNPVMGTRGFNRCIKFMGEDSTRTSLRSAKKNSDDKQGKVVHLMANALGFRKCPAPVVQSSPVQPSSVSPVSDATPPSTTAQPLSARHGFAKQAAQAISSLSPDRSVVVVLKRVSQPSQSLQHTPESDKVTPEFTSGATSDPRLSSSSLNKAAYGRAALDGVQAKVYQMPPLPPSCSTLNAFKTLLLNRTKLLSVAGQFHIPGILPVPKSMRHRVQKDTLKAEDKSLDSATSPSGTETKTSVSAESLEHEDERKETDTQENSLTAETELRDGKSAVDDGFRKNDGHSSKRLSGLSKRSRSWAEGHKTPRKLSRLVDKGSKQVVKSKLRSRRVLAAIHASHDYQLLRSRFLSLFLWPAFMSTLPVEEVKRSLSLAITRGAEAEDAGSSLSAEELEDDYHVDECSSEDDDWSKRHYKKRYAGSSGKPRVYSRWKRKDERSAAEETDAKDASMDMSLVSSAGPGTSCHPGDSSFQASQTESQKRKRVHRKRFLVLDDCRKSRRLAEKKDLKQRTEDQESVLAIEHHRAMLKATDGGEYDSESSAPRKKRRRIMPDEESDTEEKPVGTLWERSRFSGQNESGDLRANIYGSSECHMQNTLSDFVMSSDLNASSAEPADNKTGIVNSNAFLQPAYLDANGFLQPYIVGPDGILQPVVVNSSHFVDTVVDSDGFLRPSSMLQSEPSLGNACQFIQPMVLNFDEVSGSTGSQLCLAHMNGAGDAQNSAGKMESFAVVSSAGEGSLAGSSSQLSFGFDQASVTADFTAASSSTAEESDQCSMQSTDKPRQVQHSGFSEDQMDCSDFTLVTETPKHECLEELKSEVDTASSSLDQSCEEDGTIQSNYKESESDKEATNQKQVLDSNLDVLIRASELMEKNSTDAGPGTGYQTPRAPPVELNISLTGLHSYSDANVADQVRLESRSSDGAGCIVFAAGVDETGCSTPSTGHQADVDPISIHNRQLESAISATQYSCISGDTVCYSKESVSTDTHISSVTSSNVVSCFTEYDSLVTSAAEANHTVTSPALIECSSGHVDNGITINTVSAEEETSEQSAGNECSQSTIGQLELSASTATPDARSVSAYEGMDWTTTPTIATVASSESPQSSISSVRILSTVQSENDSNPDQEMKDSIESESPIASDHATDRSSAQTSVATNLVDSRCLAKSQQSSDQPTHVPLTNSSFSASNAFSLSPASPQVMMSNALPVLSTLPSVLQSATAAAVQQLTTMIMNQLLESIQMQMHQSQMQGAQNLTFPLVNALLQSTGLPSSAGLQQPALLQALSSLQLPAAFQQPPMLQQSPALQQPADLQSSTRLQSSVAYQLPGLQPPAGLLGARFPFDWSSLPGLQPGSALQADANLQPAMGLQNGAMMQTALGWQNSCPGEMDSNQRASGYLLSNSGMQGSVDSQFDNVLSGKILSAESNIQASPSQSSFSTLSKTQSYNNLQTATGYLSASPRFPGNLSASPRFSGNLPGSQPFLYQVPGNLVASQPMLHTVSGLYPLLHTASGNLPGSQPLLQTVPENLSSSQSLFQTVPGNMPGSQPFLETLPRNPPSEKAASAAAVQNTSLHSQQLHEFISASPCQSSAAMNPTASSFSQQLLGWSQLSGQFQQPLSGNTMAANSYHQITSQGLGPYVDASVLHQIHSEPTPAYMMTMHPTHQAGSLMYRAPALPGYLPSFMGMQAMNNSPTVLPVVSSSSSAPILSSSTADQQTPAPTAVSSAPESSK